MSETYKKFDASTDTLAPWRMRIYTYDTGGSMQMFYHDGRTLVQIWDESIILCNVARFNLHSLGQGWGSLIRA